MRARRLLTIISLLFAASAIAHAETEISGERQVWRTCTLTFRGPQAGESDEDNPFCNYRLQATFRHDDREIRVPGYFAADGDAANTGAKTGDRWRVKFTPDQPGKWTYRAELRRGENVALSSKADAGEAVDLQGAAGEFDVAPVGDLKNDPRNRGMLRYVGQRYLQFAGDKSWFLKAGADSPENLLGYADFDDTPATHRYQPHLRDWRAGDPTWGDGRGKGLIGALNYLAEAGVNSVYFLTMNERGDGKDVWPWIDRNTRDRFDCSKLDQWEIAFSHMDRRGIMLHVITQEQENDQLLDGGKLGPERKLYYRELIARFGHHLAVVWNLGEENTNTDEQRKEFCNYIRALDPYDHPIVVHTFPGKYRQVYEPLLGFNAFEGPSLQTNDTHRQTRLWVEESEKAGRPWVVNLDEIGPAHTGVKPDADDPTHDEVRQKHLWGNLMAGGGGCEWYFGYKWAHNDLNLEDFRSRANLWRMTRLAVDFFHEHLPFSEMQSADELTPAGDDYCFAKPGHTYAVYLPHGGEARLSLPTAKYSVAWFDPREGNDLQEGEVQSVSGPGVISLGQPPQEPNRDWVALVRLDGPPPKDTAPAVGQSPVSPPTETSKDAKIAGFTLIDADRDRPIKGYERMTGEVEIELAKLPTRNLSIIAIVEGRAAGVRFSLNGKTTQTERQAPYALTGDTNGDYNAWTPKPGRYVVEASLIGAANRESRLVMTVKP